MSRNRLEKIACIEDARVAARARVPKFFYDFVDSGSWSQSTYRANEEQFSKLRFRQRIGCDVETRSTATTLLGIESAMPMAISPTGLAGFVWPDGEIACARAAERKGIPYALSIGSVCSLEEVRKHTAAKLWMQVSILKDKVFLEGLIERARQASCDALILTLDYHVVGQRHCDIYNGMQLPPKRSLTQLVQMLQRPAWCMGMLNTRNHGFGNVFGHAKGVHDLASFAKWQAAQFVLNLSWHHVEWLKKKWGGPLIVKGVMDREDARLAVAAGADAVSVSNQGGRQLDGAPATIEVLPSIVDAVGKSAEVYLDGGVRQGQDILKALALGAKGVLTGRATLYGMAAGGEEGVCHVLKILHKELSSTMAFCGVRQIDEVDSSILWER